MARKTLVSRYRPRKLSEVIGQPVPVQAFKNAFKTNNLHHAYILAGKFGTGKTTVGRIIAAMENCEKGVTLEPCGKCRNCKEIFTGKSYDVKEIDAASNRGVDDIRALQKEAYECPINCRTKYFIIDEAHSLTAIASEAALKMIEEPPNNVRFILATTHPQKLKDTILSRCIMWRFSKVNWTELLSHLKNISQQEKVSYEDDALKLIAKASQGSVRNALQNLQAVIDYTGGTEVTLDQAQQALGVVQDRLYFDLFDAIIEENYTKGLTAIEKMFEDGTEIGPIIDGITNHLGNLIKVRACKKDLSNFSFDEEEVKKYCNQGEKIRGAVLLEMKKILRPIYGSVSFNAPPQGELESFVVESINEKKKIDDKLAKSK